MNRTNLIKQLEKYGRARGNFFLLFNYLHLMASIQHPIKISQDDLAKQTNKSRMWVKKALNALEKEQLITCKKRMIKLINFEKMKKRHYEKLDHFINSKVGGNAFLIYDYLYRIKKEVKLNREFKISDKMKQLEITQVELSDILKISRPSINQGLAFLSKNNLITFKKGLISISIR